VAIIAHVSTLLNAYVYIRMISSMKLLWPEGVPNTAHISRSRR